MAVKLPVSFSSSERDQRILAHAKSKMSFSVYVKELIEKDMENCKDSKKTQRKVTNFDF
ncbi:hypothetical protein [Clostridium sp. YIM B02551]|uniref:hypothetical protein n=1 Tax=Clostridium sp. YIM B02551 TaxID=2910679 RepID=UPI001EEA84BB|nr:hypothetical protein [Clostridium sp. YIM B02551]